MIGWAAATGDVTLLPILLFVLVFLWTPPHFWALSLYRANDYARAGVPMLPVVAGHESTRRHILAYTLALLRERRASSSRARAGRRRSH